MNFSVSGVILPATTKQASRLARDVGGGISRDHRSVYLFTVALHRAFQRLHPFCTRSPLVPFSFYSQRRFSITMR